jgi:formate hydrogenlyase subunit 4
MIGRDILLQIAQVLTVLTLAPLLQGVILKFEERVQRSQGPSVLQPLYVADCLVNEHIG